MTRKTAPPKSKSGEPTPTPFGWAVPFDTLDDTLIEKLAIIPGLRVDYIARAAVGSIDAVAAACMELSKSPPVPKYKGITLLPSKIALRDYQAAGVAQLCTLLKTYGGAVLADDMGLGKTRQAIATASSLSSGRVLICCPASVRETWREEMAKCGVPAASIAVLGPPSDSRFKKAWASASSARWVVTSYDLAQHAGTHALGDESFDFLIIDEAHAVKGRKTKRADAIEEIGQYCRYRMLITGTPFWSRPRDLYRLLRIALGTRFGSGWEFDHRYCGAVLGQYGGYEAKGATNTEELKARLGYYMVRRVKEDVLTELPALTRQVMWIDPSTAGLIAFKACFQRGMGAGNVQNALSATLGAKMDVALQLARDAGRFLLFTYRRKDAREMSQKLEESGTPNVCITGDDTPEKRNVLGKMAIEKGWGVVATLDSLSVGVNLQGVGSVGIMHYIDHVPMKTLQAEARLHRYGQKDPVTWYYLAMKESMDEMVVHSVVHKLDQWTSIMGKDGAAKLRDKLNAAVGVGEEAEKQVLSAIFKEMNELMKDGGDDQDED